VAAEGVLELLESADLSRADARGPGMDAYADRDAWLATRHDWETRHGMTVTKWPESALAELQSRARSLVELNEVLELTMYEPDDRQDPRDRPVQQMAAGVAAQCNEAQDCV
jgi:hypothetical protein